MAFGNRSLLVHLLKGLGGFGALTLALATMNESLLPSLALLPMSMYLLRGCPICWTIGLFETIVMRVHEINAQDRPRDTGTINAQNTPMLRPAWKSEKAPMGSLTSGQSM
jgi:hypothetical protein